MVMTGTPSIDELGKLGVFAGVNKFPARVKCDCKGLIESRQITKS
jgi:hypothetical protein